MKKITCIFALLLSGYFFASAQKILTVDLDTIKKNVRDKSSVFYFPTLIARFERGDLTLTKEDFKHIYYGHSFSDAFDPYGNDSGKEMEKFYEFYNKEHFREALPYGLKAISKDPVNLKLSFKLLICYHALEIKDSARLFARRYYPLLDVIYDSGDGKSIGTAMVVTTVSDEYEVLRDKKLESTSQALLAGPTDKLVLDQDSQETEPKVKELFFNVAISFEQLRKMLGDDPLTLPEPEKKRKKK